MRKRLISAAAPGTDFYYEGPIKKQADDLKFPVERRANRAPGFAFQPRGGSLVRTSTLPFLLQPPDD
jgi:hypothetical protein